MTLGVEFRYGIEISGIIEGYFLECNGLELSRDPYPYEEGGVNNFIHQLPNRAKQGKITLKRGVTTSKELWNWFQEGLYDGKVNMLNMSITLYDSEHNTLQRWNLLRAYPIRWAGPTFKSDSSQLTVETLELACHGIELAQS
jgi:phage tail-like protein